MSEGQSELLARAGAQMQRLIEDMDRARQADARGIDLPPREGLAALEQNIASARRLLQAIEDAATIPNGK